MAYYPEQRFVSEWAKIQREALLPEEVVGIVRVAEGDRVDIRDTVARGIIPARHIIIEAAQQLRLRNPAKLPDLMLVERNTRVQYNQPLAGKNPERGRRVLSPAEGIVVYIGEGRIILQEAPQVINLEAGVRGRVRTVYEGRGVSIEAAGAVVQGVWGNGKNALAVIRKEPAEKLENLTRDTLEQAYRNEIIFTNRPVTAPMLEVAAIRSLAGIIAPSMGGHLLDAALASPFAILLTEGFGSFRITNAVYNVLEKFEGNQATLDAYQPRRWEPRRPEIVINRQRPQETMDERSSDIALRKGLRVRITRAPHTGFTGTVVELPNVPLLLDNGLRVRCARVELLPGEIVVVPLANLELAGT